MSKKVKINEGHYLELMDRIMIQVFTIEDYLYGHPLSKKFKKVRKLINQSSMHLTEAYQIIGRESYKLEKKKNGIKKVVLGRHKKSED